jgi:hypothetical protein
MGAIQDAVLAVLRDATEALPPREIHVRAERWLGRSASYNTVVSFLSVAARASASPILRREPGLYRIEARPTS